MIFKNSSVWWGSREQLMHMGFYSAMSGCLEELMGATYAYGILLCHVWWGSWEQLMFMGVYSAMFGGANGSNLCTYMGFYSAMSGGAQQGSNTCTAKLSTVGHLLLTVSFFCISSISVGCRY